MWDEKCGEIEIVTSIYYKKKNLMWLMFLD